MIRLIFDAGSIVLTGEKVEMIPIIPYILHDERIDGWRAPAYLYNDIINALDTAGQSYLDDSQDYKSTQFKLELLLELRDYQDAALEAWESVDARGVIVLPTGVGKSIVGIQAIANKGVPTLVVLPTIDLMNQWATQLEKFFVQDIGMYGGGEKTLCPITCITYDSAVIMMEFIGNKFGLIIFDECHHLPSPIYRSAAEMALAPFRLGLSATPERPDGGEQFIYKLIGEPCFRKEIDEFESSTLSVYETETIHVEMTEEETKEYQHYRQIYTDFLKKYRINFASKYAWNKFLQHCARMPDGQDAMDAYQRQKQLAAASEAKLAILWELIKEHKGERMIIFTNRNDLAYLIGEQFFFPVITHLTKAKERKLFLDNFRSGDYKVLVTSKVLNEGIDVPEASVGVVVSGSGSVREHVQRLGRILRPTKDKKAFLYELISVGTGESNISQRRRQHRAYQNKK